LLSLVHRDSLHRAKSVKNTVYPALAPEMCTACKTMKKNENGDEIETANLTDIAASPHPICAGVSLQSVYSRR
jgi:hypothetical protein